MQALEHGPEGDLERVLRYWEGELSTAEHARFEAHVQLCPKCAELLAATRLVAPALDEALGPPNSSGAERDAALDGLALTRKGPPARLPAPRHAVRPWALAVAVGVVLLGTVIWLKLLGVQMPWAGQSNIMDSPRRRGVPRIASGEQPL